MLKPVESSSQVLQLDAWPEELSEAQLEKHRQNESQIKELDLQVQQLITKYNAEIIYESESCSLYDLDVNLPPLALPSGFLRVVFFYQQKGNLILSQIVPVMHHQWQRVQINRKMLIN